MDRNYENCPERVQRGISLRPNSLEDYTTRIDQDQCPWEASAPRVWDLGSGIWGVGDQGRRACRVQVVADYPRTKSCDAESCRRKLVWAYVYTNNINISIDIHIHDVCICIYIYIYIYVCVHIYTVLACRSRSKATPPAASAVKVRVSLAPSGRLSTRPSVKRRPTFAMSIWRNRPRLWSFTCVKSIVKFR